MFMVSASTILKAVEPEQVFGKLDEKDRGQVEQLRSTYQYMARAFNPDLDPKATVKAKKKASAVMAALNVPWDAAEAKIEAGTYAQPTRSMKENKSDGV
jgi:hypothetical protein